MPKNQKQNDGPAAGDDTKKMFDAITDPWESKYGHGWKRRFSEFAGVPESTVHSWLKAQRMPPWVARITEMSEANKRLQRRVKVYRTHIDDCAEAGQIAKTDNGFAVYRFTDGIGKLVCDNIASEDMATEIASLPRLKNIVHRVQGFLATISDSPELYADEDVAETEELLLELSDWARLAVLSDKAASLSEQDVAAVREEVAKSSRN